MMVLQPKKKGLAEAARLVGYVCLGTVLLVVLVVLRMVFQPEAPRAGSSGPAGPWQCPATTGSSSNGSRGGNWTNQSGWSLIELRHLTGGCTKERSLSDSITLFNHSDGGSGD